MVLLAGFLLVTTAQWTNTIPARSLGGSAPPFTLAFFLLVQP